MGVLSLIPPVAPPVRIRTLLRSLAGATAQQAVFAEALAAAAGRRGAELFRSGRSALAEVLRRSSTPGRDEVVLPGYTCWTVPAAAVRAGLRIRLVDVDPVTLDVDPDALSRAPLDRVAAAVVCHLCAGTADVEGAARLLGGRDRSVLVIEDAAQAWPAGRTAAHAVVLSFGRGKPLPLGSGGALLHDDPVDPAPERAGGWAEAAALFGTVALARPGTFRLPESIPALAIGATVYDPSFAHGRGIHGWQARLGLDVVARLPLLARSRSEHAGRLAGAFGGKRGWTVTVPAGGRGPLRLPVLAPSAEARDEAVAHFRRKGVAASPLYPGTLADIPALRTHLVGAVPELPGAREIAGRLLTVPTYPDLRDRDLAAIERAIESLPAA